jgi:hypothetical protein
MHAAQLRHPSSMIELAQYFKECEPSSTLIHASIEASIWDWHVAGNSISTAKHEELDIERMERDGELTVYSKQKATIYLQKPVPLVRLDEAFGCDPRRTLNRLFEKIEKPNTRATDAGLLPAIFWLDLARKIMKRVRSDSLRGTEPKEVIVRVGDGLGRSFL